MNNILDSILRPIRNLFGSSNAKAKQNLNSYLSSQRYASIRAKYESAQKFYGTIQEWKNADALSAREANSADVRKTLRERSRYLCANNCHARGITLAMANDMIGTGPRLQILFDDEGVCDAIESAWREWADAISLGQKLHTFHLASEVDGEAFALLSTNPTLPSSVQLDVALRDCDMVTEPDSFKANSCDGIEFDAYGNPISYRLLREHPGDGKSFAAPKADRIPARLMLHWFREDRPQQCRGVPALTPALPILLQLGRYSQAVLMAAELAADYAVFISTDQAVPDLTDEEKEILCMTPWSTMPVTRGMVQVLPHTWKANQLTPTQPITSYAEYTKALLREACHALLIPYNIACSDFEGDSYAGGRLSLQSYQRQIKIRRAHFRTRILDRIFAAWLDEAMRIPKLLPSSLPTSIASIPHAWFFDGWGHVDPTKEATAITTRLNNFTTTLSAECAEAGTDWRKVIRQRSAEIELQKKFGVLILPPGTPPLDDVKEDRGTENIEEVSEVNDAA